MLVKPFDMRPEGLSACCTGAAEEVCWQVLPQCTQRQHGLHDLQVHHSELAQESMLHWPAVSSSIAPQLYSLYSQAMSSGEEQAAAEAAGQGTPPHTHTREDATEQATAAVAMADEMAAAEAAEPETALEMIPPPTEMAEPPAEALDMGMAEPDLFQHQEGGAGTTLSYRTFITGMEHDVL